MSKLIVLQLTFDTLVNNGKFKSHNLCNIISLKQTVVKVEGIFIKQSLY
jgi:hypothetical protein